MKSGQKYAPIALTICCTWQLLTLGCGQGPEAAGKPTKTEPNVAGELYTVELQNLPTVAKVQGSLFVDESATIAAKVAGRVVEVNCDLGDQVAQGQLLIRIDDAEYRLKVTQMQAQLSQARAAIGLEPSAPVASLNPMNSPPVREAKAVLDEAQKQVQRLAELYSQGAIVATDLEAAQSMERVSEARFNSALNSVREKIANVDVQTAQLDLAKQDLVEAQVLSPFNGTVQRRLVAVGTYVQAGQALVELVRTDQLRYRAAVPERFAQRLAIGQKVSIQLAGQKREVQITRISPALDPVTRSLTFEAMLANDDKSLRGGLFAAADVVVDETSQAIVVPDRAVMRFAGTDKAFVVSDGKVKEAVLQLGRQVGDQLEILGGLKPGDQILSNAKNGQAGKYVGATAAASGELALQPGDGGPAGSNSSASK